MCEHTVKGMDAVSPSADNTFKSSGNKLTYLWKNIDAINNVLLNKQLLLRSLCCSAECFAVLTIHEAWYTPGKGRPYGKRVDRRLRNARRGHCDKQVSLACEIGTPKNTLISATLPRK